MAQKMLVNTLTPGAPVAVDPISQVFIKVELLFGLNRLRVLDRQSFRRRFLVTLYCVSVNLVILYLAVSSCPVSTNFRMMLNITTYYFNVIFSFIVCGKLRLYFNEMNTFDMAVSCKPKVLAFLKQHAILHVIMVVVVVADTVSFLVREKHACQFFIFHLLALIEYYFLAHLFCTIDPRLRLINFFVESLLNKSSRTDIRDRPSFFKHCTQCKPVRDCRDIHFLMDLYEIIINAHCRLIDAVKWQETNPLSYWEVFSSALYIGSNILCLLMPCAHRDQIHGEVRRLRVLLASLLYENNICKRSRGTARAMLLLIHEYDLSVSLLGMLRVDISLPLHYVSLLVTHLIILLQFQKVQT
ncbi:unnamed protein product [Plutella xylostella]|uniref:Gustatory receptor n=1 Tax=Plutella xylostella TaxID=51655 RepID=A0A8S4E9B0_PLUXY|nr:unnamed protein product [Plutella xylostella]